MITFNTIWLRVHFMLGFKRKSEVPKTTWTTCPSRKDLDQISILEATDSCDLLDKTWHHQLFQIITSDPSFWYSRYECQSHFCCVVDLHTVELRAGGVNGNVYSCQERDRPLFTSCKDVFRLYTFFSLNWVRPQKQCHSFMAPLNPAGGFTTLDLNCPGENIQDC